MTLGVLHKWRLLLLGLFLFFYFFISCLYRCQNGDKNRPALTCNTRFTQRKSNSLPLPCTSQQKKCNMITWLLLFSCALLDTGRVRSLQCIRRCVYANMLTNVFTLGLYTKQKHYYIKADTYKVIFSNQGCSYTKCYSFTEYCCMSVQSLFLINA